MLSIHDFSALEDFRRRHHIDVHALQRFRNSLFKQGDNLPTALQQLPAGNRDLFAKEVTFQFLELRASATRASMGRPN